MEELEKSLFNEQGNLTKSGKLFFDDCLKKQVISILGQVKTVSQARVLGSLLTKYVGDLSFERILLLDKESTNITDIVKTEDTKKG
jgi:hypothetical protein